MVFATPAMADDILRSALTAAEAGDEALRCVLEELPAAIYVTDAEGFVTFFNSACVDFAGRTPKVGRDRWCVAGKLFTEDGEYLPHDRCPMAVAVQTRQRVRGVFAVAERPDGSRVKFLPYPTPLFGHDDEFLGTINILIDVTDSRQADFLEQQAQKCRRLALTVLDRKVLHTLNQMAEEYETKARALRGS
jgi:PAS domain S-box-containing protein